MKTFEIILKLAFLALSVAFVLTGNIYSPLFSVFLIVCIVLGLVLIINHHASYNFQQKRSDLILRRVEGGVLIIFAALTSMMGL